MRMVMPFSRKQRKHAAGVPGLAARLLQSLLRGYCVIHKFFLSAQLSFINRRTLLSPRPLQYFLIYSTMK